MRSNARKVCLIVALIFIAFFAGSIFLQIYNNKTNAVESSSLIMDQLEDVVDSNDVKSVIDQIPVTEGMDIYLASIDDGTIVGSTNKRCIGQQARSNVSRMQLLEKGKRHMDTTDLNGDTCYVQYERVNDYVIIVTYAESVANKNLAFTMLILGAVLFFSFCLICVIVNSAFQAMEESLRKVEKANQAKTQFLSRMSHDIRTPLNGIVGLLEIDAKHADDRELVDSNRKKAKVAADHLLSLISDVLELSKMDDEQVELAHEPFDIVRLASDILTMTELRASEMGITIVHENCEEKDIYPYVYGSPLHVKRVILNIFSNAIKYNKPNGSISCKMQMLSKNETTVVYQTIISDTGIGMSPEFLQHMFEPFSQEHSDARSTYQGTGLGMAIVKSLLDKMDGSVEVESVEGEGSTFKVTIPFETAREQDMPKKDEVAEVNLEGVRILVVEDNELNMEIATVILKDIGASVEEAHNGLEAVEAFTGHEPGTYDVILMDLMMPVMDGYEAARTIRACDRADAKSIPIVAMTANAFAEDARKCMEAGMNGHLAKPIEIARLMEMLAKVLQ